MDQDEGEHQLVVCTCHDHGKITTAIGRVDGAHREGGQSFLSRSTSTGQQQLAAPSEAVSHLLQSRGQYESMIGWDVWRQISRSRPTIFIQSSTVKGATRLKMTWYSFQAHLCLNCLFLNSMVKIPRSG